MITNIKQAAPERVEADLAAVRSKDMWSFSDLVLLGYCNDRATIRRRIVAGSFPEPVILSGNSIAWVAAEVRACILNRPRGFAPQPPRRQRKSNAPVSLAKMSK